MEFIVPLISKNNRLKLDNKHKTKGQVLTHSKESNICTEKVSIRKEYAGLEGQLQQGLFDSILHHP